MQRDLLWHIESNNISGVVFLSGGLDYAMLRVNVTKRRDYNNSNNAFEVIPPPPLLPPPSPFSLLPLSAAVSFFFIPIFVRLSSASDHHYPDPSSHLIAGSVAFSPFHLSIFLLLFLSSPPLSIRSSQVPWDRKSIRMFAFLLSSLKHPPITSCSSTPGPGLILRVLSLSPPPLISSSSHHHHPPPPLPPPVFFLSLSSYDQVTLSRVIYRSSL